MCLDREEIERLLRGEEGAEKLAGFQAHAHGCARCEEQVRPAAEQVLLERAALGGGHPDALTLSRYLDQDAAPGLKLLLEIHLRTCPECRERLDRMRAGRARAAAEPMLAVSHRPILADPPGRSWGGAWLPLLAAGCAVVLIAVFLTRPGQQVARNEPPRPSAPAPAGQFLAQDGPVRLVLAGGTVVAHGLDPEAAAVYREMLPGGDLALPDSMRRYVVRGPGSGAPAEPDASPAPDQVVRLGPVRFRWRGEVGREYRLEVFTHDRKDRPAHGVAVTGPTAEVSGLRDGEEYTWIVTDGEGEETVSERSFRLLDGTAAAEIERIERAYPEARLLRGSVYLKHGLVPEALEEYRKAAEAAGGSGAAERIYAQLRRAVGAESK